MTARLSPRLLAPCGFLFGLLAATPATAQMKQFGEHWIATCDNQRNCSAYGVNATRMPGYIRIDRAAAPDAELKIKLAIREPGRPFRLAFDPAVPGIFPENDIEQRHDADDYMRIAITAPTEALIAALRDAKAIAYEPVKIASLRDAPGGRLALTGAIDALAWIDAQQQRDGTQTALVKRGEKPASAVPPAPQTATLTRARTTPGGRPPDYPRALHGKKDSCGTTGRDSEHLRSEWLGDAHVMHLFYCNKEVAGKYNAAFVLFEASAAKPDAVREIRLEYPAAVAATEGTATIYNPDFDRETGILQTDDRPSADQDCGTTARWAWTGREFELVMLIKMPVCAGIGMHDWPVLYRAEMR